MPTAQQWFSVAMACLALAYPYVKDSWHSVDEGHLGLYYRGGKLMPGVAQPGVHFMVPFLYRFEQVPIGLRTEEVRKVPCGTSGGVVLHFDHIEVVCRVAPSLLWSTAKNYSTTSFIDTWIREPLHHEVNQLCSKFTLHDVFIGRFADIDEMLREALRATHAQWAPGLEVLSVRLSKPVIPDAIRENFMAIAAKTTELKTTTEKQAVALAAAEKERSLAVMDASKRLGVARQGAAALVAQAKQQVAITNMSTMTEVARVAEQAQARHYARLKEAEANRHTLTAGFLALQRQRHALKNTVLYWGDALPSSIVVGDEEEGNGGGGGGEERRVEEEAALLASHLEGRGRGAWRQ